VLIPRYWAKTEGSVMDPSGKRYQLRLWGWSQESRSDAFDTARRRLSEIASRIAGGQSLEQYFYGKQPLREEIIRMLGEPKTKEEAVITRNRYGALVMNTTQVPFIDIDAPEIGAVAKLIRFFTGGDKASPDPMLDRIRATCRTHRRDSFRIYRTKAGYRVLATDLFLDPCARSTQDLFSEFAADTYFMKLCAVQASFRARLTPKPWRIGCLLPPGQYPRDAPEVQRRFQDWLQRYESASTNFATCKFLESVGSGQVASEARVIIEEHDRIARARSDLPLA
jgi:hypothetical protein